MTNWLIKNKEVLSISGLEKAIGCPNSTLQKAIQGKQGLPKKWAEKLQEYIKENLTL